MQLETLQKDTSAVMCFTEVKFWSEHTNQYIENTALKFIHKNRFTFYDILALNVVSTASVLFKNIFLNDGLPAGFTKFPIGDWPLYLYLLMNGDAIYIDKVTSIYRYHSGGVYSPLTEQKRKLLNISVYKLFIAASAFKNYRSAIEREISINYLQVIDLELKKEQPDKTVIKKALLDDLKNMNAKNIRLPVKSFLKYILYTLHLK